jgi:hypothetical protein
MVGPPGLYVPAGDAGIPVRPGKYGANQGIKITKKITISSG